jgi:hypothetical protein
MGGQILDATIVQARPARLTGEEKAAIREGKTPAGWSPAKRAQIDCDARLTLKHGPKRPSAKDETSRRPRVLRKLRVAVDHVFVCQPQHLRLVVRTVGLARAETNLGFASPAHSLFRFVWLEAPGAPALHHLPVVRFVIGLTARRCGRNTRHSGRPTDPRQPRRPNDGQPTCS